MSVSDNVFGYPEPIWERFRGTAFAGRFAPGTPGLIAGEAGTPAAKSVLRLEFRVEAGTVLDARFQAYGCPTSIAVGRWIAECSVGQPVQALAGIDARRLRAELEIPDQRAHCALMGEDAIRAALRPEASSLSGLEDRREGLAP